MGDEIFSRSAVLMGKSIGQGIDVIISYRRDMVMMVRSNAPKHQSLFKGCPIQGPLTVSKRIAPVNATSTVVKEEKDHDRII
jgi:hypothetical protein